MICVKCGWDITTTAKFCPECGATQTKAAPISVKCVTCKAKIPEFATFCYECGAERTASPSNSLEPVEVGAKAEPDGGRLPSPADAKDDRPIIACASSSVPEDSEPKQSSGRLKLVLICGALVLAFALAGALIPRQRDTGIAHFKRGEELKMTGDYKGAKQELEVCLSECKGWEGNTAREELERIEPLIAAQEKPQPSAEETERQKTVRDPDDCGMGFKRGKHYVPNPNGLNDDLAVIGCSYGVSFDMACSMTCDPKPVDVRTVQ